MAIRRVSLLSCFVLAVSVASAQSYTAKKIVFKHAEAFPQKQMELVSGFHPGMTFQVDDLSTAAQKLADTGYFGNVGVTLDGAASGVTVNFDLTPANPAQFLPVAFENFIWLTPDEMTAAVRTKVPLYNGTLPEVGAQADDAASGLKAALDAKGVAGATFAVQHETMEPTLAHPERVIDFRITKPAVVVADIHLTGVTKDLAPLLQQSVNKTARTLYNSGASGFVTEDSILAPILDAGYAQAKLDGVTVDVAPVVDAKEPVTVHATLNAGAIYHVDAITFAGAPLYSADEFAKNAKLHAGDVAGRKDLIATLTPLDQAYRDKGYMDVVVRAEPAFAGDKVSYTVTVVPGEPYKVHEVHVQGLDAAAQADFDQYFRLHAGDVYNPGYVAGFIKNNTAVASLGHYGGSWRATAYPETHTVDLDVMFVPGGGKVEQITVHAHP